MQKLGMQCTLVGSNQAIQLYVCPQRKIKTFLGKQEYPQKAILENCIADFAIERIMLHMTGDFFEEWNEITRQTHIRKFEELMA